MANQRQIGFMVEFPVCLQLTLKIVASHQRHISISRSGALNGEVIGNLSILSEDGEVILPGHRHEIRHPAHSPAVLELDGIPFPIRRIYDGPLGHASVRQSQIVVQYVSSCKFSFQRIRHKAGFRSPPHIRSGMNQEEVVFSVNLVQVTSLVAQMGIILVIHNETM